MSLTVHSGPTSISEVKAERTTKTIVETTGYDLHLTPRAAAVLLQITNHIGGPDTHTSPRGEITKIREALINAGVNASTDALSKINRAIYFDAQ